MNTLSVLILLILVAAWALEAASSLLTMRALNDGVPEEFAPVTDAGRYATSQAYARANARLNLVSETAGLVVVVLAMRGGAFNWLDKMAMALFDAPIAQGLAFFALLSLASYLLLSLPTALYRTFVLEERYGFNRTTPALFMLDALKSMLLAAIIGGPLLSGVLWFFAALGSWAWLAAWAFTVLAMLAIQYVAPVIILPLFNTFTPLPEGDLRTRIEDYVRAAGFALSGLFVMDGSKRSGKGNAFFTGFGRKKRIALFDTLVNAMSHEQVVAVVAHEVGHCKLGHIHRMLGFGILRTGLTFLLLSFVLTYPPLFNAFGMDRMSTHAGIVFFSFLYTPLSLLLGMCANSRSRAHEFEADAFAARTTKKAETLASALITLSITNLSNLTPHPFTVFLHHSHPPVVERIRRLRANGGDTAS